MNSEEYGSKYSKMVPVLHNLLNRELDLSYIADEHTRLYDFLYLLTWDESPWIHTQRKHPGSYGHNNQTSKVQIVSTDSLESFRLWTMDYEKSLPKHDHAVAVTRLELINPDYSKSVEGVAWPESICSKQGFSISIVEDFALARTVWSVVHELMHSLGADHGNLRGTRTCVFEDFGYLRRYSEQSARKMTPFEESAKTDNTLSGMDNSMNPEPQAATYKMAKCAVKMVAMHVRKSRPFVSCLYETYADWTGSLRDQMRAKDYPGQVLPADKQCQLMLGNDYIFCQHKKWYAHYLCQRVFCIHKDDVQNRTVECSSVWTQVPALYATSCGNGQWCHDGECVNDPQAPFKSEVCHHHTIDRHFCDHVVLRYPWACDVPEIRKHCCKRCQRLRERRNQDLEEHYTIIQDLVERW